MKVGKSYQVHIFLSLYVAHTSVYFDLEISGQIVEWNLIGKLRSHLDKQVQILLDHESEKEPIRWILQNGLRRCALLIGLRLRVALLNAVEKCSSIKLWKLRGEQESLEQESKEAI